MKGNVAMSKKMAEYFVQIAVNDDGSLAILLVDRNTDTIVADVRMGFRSILPDLFPRLGAAASLDLEIQRVTKSGGTVHDLFSLGEGVFGQFDDLRVNPHGRIMEKCFLWLTNNIAPDYDMPDIQTCDDNIVLFADSERINRRKACAAEQRNAEKTGEPRPKSISRDLNDIWF